MSPGPQEVAFELHSPVPCRSPWESPWLRTQHPVTLPTGVWEGAALPQLIGVFIDLGPAVPLATSGKAKGWGKEKRHQSLSSRD